MFLGLAGAIFLVILGLTGSVMAFEGDIDRWIHPGLWYVQTAAHTLPQQELIRMVEQRVAPARVHGAHVFRQADVAEVMQMSDGSNVFVSPYDGSIKGRREGRTRADKLLGEIHQIHLRLTPDPRSTPRLAEAGKLIISYAGAILCLMVPSGAILWWRTRRTRIKWKGSWFRICFDAHHVVGIYAGIFLFIAAFTGILIGFDWGERVIYATTHSTRPRFAPPPASTPLASATPITVDQAIAIARRTMPNTTISDLLIPIKPQESYSVALRAPEETSEAVHSMVTIDQYTGKVLAFQNFLTDSPGYRVIRFNRSIHTGDVGGLPTHILMSLSSLLLVVMVITGFVIWWKKLAV